MTPCQDHFRAMELLKRRHDPLLALVDGRSVQYLDIPVHSNVGDLLIYLGTLEFLKRNGICSTQTSAYFNYRNHADGSALLLHGGGNLGDLYPEHQQFRERVIRENPRRRIIVLPQTIHFEEPDTFERAKRVFGSHQDLHLFVRDHQSLLTARQLCSNVHLAPDMAHQLYPIKKKPVAPQKDRLKLFRTDKESPADFKHQETAASMDWPDITGTTTARQHRRYIRLLKSLNWVGLDSATSPLFASFWRREATRLASKAIALFSCYESIITNRLHGHILACLMDMPNVVLDNNYGKNFGYVRAWTAGSPLVTATFSQRNA